MTKCDKCHISVKPYYRYCPNCGALLHNKFNRNSLLILCIFTLAMVFAAAAYVKFFSSNDPALPMENWDKSLNPVDLSAKKQSSFHGIFSKTPPAAPQALPLVVGQVIIHDIAGNETVRISAAVSKSGWIAIPARFCIAGYSWYFYSNNTDAREIHGGILGDHDDVGLWQLERVPGLSGAPVFPANTDRPMTWRSIVSKKDHEMDNVTILSEQQNFYHVLPGGSPAEPGVLIQEGKIVGWTFGDAVDGAYLWKGPDESNLVYELSVDDFYRLTFEGSREEQFIVAYSQKDMLPERRLETFANGFRQEPVLFDDNTPAHLKPEAVIQQMRAIISQIMDKGNPFDIVAIFDATVLSGAGDPAFLIDVLTLNSQVSSPENAITIVENILADPGDFDKSQQYQIRQFQKELYGKWLTRLIAEKNYSKGLAVYRKASDFFVDAPDIRLLGVKLALVFDDWQTAEEILYLRQFPIDLTDQVRTLKAQIAELKFQEDKIVVRFSPGAGRVPVNGVVNGHLYQDFVIDTGATMVTIPTTAAEKLGIDIDASTPVHRLITAGGVIEAPQIRLDSITLGGWTEYNVTAYVVDMPDQSGLGLLGLNYLNRFRMDLNTKAGVLTLAPR